MDLPASLRNSIDYCFCMREAIPAVKKRIYEYFFGVVPKRADFDKLMNACTENRECIVLDNIRGLTSTKVEECVYCYKATLDTRTRRDIISSKFRRLHQALYQPSRPHNDGMTAVIMGE